MKQYTMSTFFFAVQLQPMTDKNPNHLLYIKFYFHFIKFLSKIKIENIIIKKGSTTILYLADPIGPVIIRFSIIVKL